MSRIKRARPALVIVVFALIAAVAGTALAGSGPDANTAGKAGQALKKAKKALKKAKKNKAAINDIELTPGPQGPAGPPANVDWAVVSNPNGAGNISVVRSSNGVTATEATYAQIDFGKNISQCAWVATKGNPATGVAGAGFAQTHLGNVNSQVRVATRNAAGVLVNAPFHLTVYC